MTNEERLTAKPENTSCGWEPIRFRQKEEKT